LVLQYLLFRTFFFESSPVQDLVQKWELLTVKSVDNGRSGAPIGCRFDAWRVSTIVLKTGPVSEPMRWLAHWLTGLTSGSAGSIALKNH
jgi:hypothetical protein